MIEEVEFLRDIGESEKQIASCKGVFESLGEGRTPQALVA
jgi:hypothetical protein